MQVECLLFFDRRKTAVIQIDCGSCADADTSDKQRRSEIAWKE